MGQNGGPASEFAKAKGTRQGRKVPQLDDLRLKEELKHEFHVWSSKMDTSLLKFEAS